MREATHLLSEAKRLYELGLAVHWLHPRQKRPLGSWRADERQDFARLQSAYRADLNLGVKLGLASHVADGYLACLDCDVKSDDPAHRTEMEKRLEALCPGALKSSPCVTSGRGLGSRHIYGLSSQPAPKRMLAQSRDIVRVLMPSTPPSRHEENTLSPLDLKKGVRLRPAWEICLMGKGCQMVLPPSIHPDSGKRYVWDIPFKSVSDLADFNSLLHVEHSSETREKNHSSQTNELSPSPFQAVEIDLTFDTRISAQTLSLLWDAEVEDRSKAVFQVIGVLQAAQFTSDEILTVLTDPEYKLAWCAYDHIQKPRELKYRSQAAGWLRKYCLDPAHQKMGAHVDFEKVDPDGVGDIPLPALEASLQEETLLGDRTDQWQAHMKRSGSDGEGPPKCTLHNIVLIFENAVGPLVFRKNLFTGFEIHGMDTPWGARTGSEIQDDDLVGAKMWLAQYYRFEPPTNLINEAVMDIARRNAFHPVRDYLNTLEWDGISRIDGWLKKYLNAQAPEPYLSAISRKVLCALVARVFQPGVKFDTVLILEGKQGIYKSTVIRKLVGDEWFSDAHIEIKDKDAILAMRGIWLVELGELSSMKKGDVDQMKEFMSRMTDRIRKPYGRRTENFPRQCVFIGTTNNTEYFRDSTGNRRFWPIEVGECDWEGIEKVRDQLFAEARWMWDLGETLYLDDREAQLGAQEEQEKREVSDEWVEILDESLDEIREKEVEERPFDPDCFAIHELFGIGGPFENTRMNRYEQMRAGECVKKLGFKKIRTRVKGKKVRRWAGPTFEVGPGDRLAQEKCNDISE